MRTYRWLNLCTFALFTGTLSTPLWGASQAAPIYDVTSNAVSHQLTADTTDTPDNDALNLSNSIDNLPPGPAVLFFPPGVYHFMPTPNAAYCLNLQNKADLKFVCSAGSATWLMTDRTTGGVRIEDCSNVTLEGMVLEWQERPFTQGSIHSVDNVANEMVVVIETGLGYKTPAQDPYLDPFSTTGIQKALIFSARKICSSGMPTSTPDFATARHKAQSAQITVGPLLSLSSDPPNSIRLSSGSSSSTYFEDHKIEVGDAVLLRARKQRSPVYLRTNQNCLLKDLTIHWSPTNGVYSLNNDGLQLQNVHVVPKVATDLQSSLSDGFHLTGSLSGPTLEDCVVDRSGDDAIVVRGAFFEVADLKPDSSGFVEVIYDRRGWQPVSGLKVQFFDVNGDFSRSQSTLILGHTLNPSSAARVQLSAGDLPSWLDPGDRMEVIGWQSEGYSISGCTASRNYGTGIHVKAVSGSIVNNRLDQCSRAGIVLGPDLNWIEGGFSDYALIEGNQVSDCGFQLRRLSRTGGICVSLTPKGSGPIDLTTLVRNHGTIIVCDNVIEKCGHSGLFMACVKDGLVTGNRIIGCQRRTFDYSDPMQAGLPATPYFGTLHYSALGLDSEPDTVIALVNSNASIEGNELDAENEMQAWNLGSGSNALPLGNMRSAFVRFESEECSAVMPGNWDCPTPPSSTFNAWGSSPWQHTHAPLVGAEMDLTFLRSGLYGDHPCYPFWSESQTAFFSQGTGSISMPVEAFRGVSFKLGTNTVSADWNLEVSFTPNSNDQPLKLVLTQNDLDAGPTPRFTTFSMPSLDIQEDGLLQVNVNIMNGFIYLDDLQVMSGFVGP